MQSDPIIAVSSPPGRSHRGIVRVSGEDLRGVIEAMLTPMPRPRDMTACRIRFRKAAAWPCGGFPGVPVVALYHPGPRSFTGQDVLEIQVPGNPALLERVLHGVVEQVRATLGAGRLAEPGEFTQRAFAAGRIDLTRAEGIAATISATADAQLEAAKLLRTGRLGQWSVDLVNQLGGALALVEAGIDFTDQEDVTPIAPPELDRRLAVLEAELDQMLRRSRAWAPLEALPWVVLVGPPNAGKSTLFNALLGRTRAVVSDIAGTTRDVLTEPMRVGDRNSGGEVMLVDVAGLDRGEGLLDAAMQKAAQEAIARAELILLLDERMAAPREGVPVIRLAPKADLHEPRSGEALPISALTGQGLDELRRRIAEVLRDRAVTLSGEMLALQPRHRQEITASLEAVRAARQLLEPQRTSRTLSQMELIAGTMRQALDHLGALGGQLTPDDVLGRIFSTFCIGK